MVSVITQSARASQIGSTSAEIILSLVVGYASWRIRSTFVALGLAIHSWVAVRISSCSSHSTVFPLLRVRINCTSAVIMFTASCYPFWLWGHCGA